MYGHFLGRSNKVINTSRKSQLKGLDIDYNLPPFFNPKANSTCCSDVFERLKTNSLLIWISYRYLVNRCMKINITPLGLLCAHTCVKDKDFICRNLFIPTPSHIIYT